MPCWHYYAPSADGHESAFSIDASRIVFGNGVLAELGEQVRALGCKRVALFTDRRLASLEHVARARRSLRDANIDAALFDAVHVEPTDASFLEAARFAKEARADGYVSVGGGSVIDTCKAASLYATYPADFLDYVNKPVGAARPVPGPLPPHVACPTTCGTGSETTGIAVCDVLALGAKTGIASPRLRPSLALVDPTCTHTLPPEVVAASGFDVLCHALESYTARPYGVRPRPAPATARPMSQGANPWSDLGSAEALRLTGKYLVRAVTDASDLEAREKLAWAATLAGVAFGNAGVHLPHGMAYAVAGLVRDFRMPGYPREEPMVPHGVSVVLNAPSVFRFTASACPERHLEAAGLLGTDARGAAPADAGEVVAGALVAAMRATRIPNGLGAVGYGPSDVGALTKGTIVQQRLLSNSPRDAGEPELDALFAGAMRYW
ncbi:MAG TPA: hydroxyacid-oxoacid transhydrogenase [Polyangiaceae bacterium]|nr:hydroxyacid-oxoacid transhydrogenase [Polyangiaceae bacterium]